VRQENCRGYPFDRPAEWQRQRDDAGRQDDEQGYDNKDEQRGDLSV
jgi:hypothetical protein